MSKDLDELEAKVKGLSTIAVMARNAFKFKHDRRSISIEHGTTIVDAFAEYGGEIADTIETALALIARVRKAEERAERLAEALRGLLEHVVDLRTMIDNANAAAPYRREE